MSSDPPEEPFYFENRQRKIGLDERAIGSFLTRLSKDVARGAEFAVVVTSDAAVRSANRNFRGVSRTTDVLSFPDGEAGRLGDVLISASRAARQAADFGHAVETELQVLILHGLLHLVGHDHEIDDGMMSRVETRLRCKYSLPGGLIERVDA